MQRDSLLRAVVRFLNLVCLHAALFSKISVKMVDCILC